MIERGFKWRRSTPYEMRQRVDLTYRFVAVAEALRPYRWSLTGPARLN